MHIELIISLKFDSGVFDFAVVGSVQVDPLMMIMPTANMLPRRFLRLASLIPVLKQLLKIFINHSLTVSSRTRE